MADYYTKVTPDDGIPCTQAEADAIDSALLKAWEEHDIYHGFTFEWESSLRAGETPPTVGLGYLQAEENGNAEEIPEAILQQIGALLGQAGMAYLEFGVAWSCSRMRAGSCGGTAFRLYPNGTLVFRLETWPEPVEPHDLVPEGWIPQGEGEA